MVATMPMAEAMHRAVSVSVGVASFAPLRYEIMYVMDTAYPAVSAMRSPMPRRMLRQSDLTTATIGDLTISPLSLTFSNTGDSGTLARMIRPTTTSRMLARNGTRHAQSPP